MTKFSSLTGHIVLSLKQTRSRNKTVHNEEVPSGAYIYFILFIFWRAGCQRLVAAEEGCRPPLLYNAALLL